MAVCLQQIGVRFLINKDIASNIEEFNSINENVAGIINKLNKRHTLDVIQAYVPTSSHDD